MARTERRDGTHVPGMLGGFDGLWTKSIFSSVMSCTSLSGGDVLALLVES